MRVDFSEQILLKDVENMIEIIDKLKEISIGTREFIRYSYLYYQIFHSNKPLEDPTDIHL
ncbi:16313_t:CDS:2 [Funneliformis mosseae]|uniref:16313_t:CDS:1 n=1 Tax=Funneliformis mosseae TaxID=27381 RepID=A0A9N9D199_FUNMO|nr:16313_t:CDS:2 [Funneliformis mosseae]